MTNFSFDDEKFATTNSQKVASMVLFILTFATVWMLTEVLFRIIIAKMVHTNIQSQTDALRSTMAKLGFFIASFLTSIVYQYLEQYALLMGSMTLLMLLGYIYSWRFLCNIRKMDI